MTFSEYLSYQAPPGFRDELIHGEIVLSPCASRKHADFCHVLVRLLEDCVHGDYVARLDTTHTLGESEGPRPDVFVISRERWIAADKTGGYPEGSPELAIEVLSPSNDDLEMRTKRELYLSDPRCLEVWEVDEPTKSVRCFGGRAAHSRTYGLTDAIPMPTQIGFGSISIKAIFDGIVREVL